MSDLPQKHHAAAVALAEELVDTVRGEVQRLLDGLADRPKPGAKQDARDAVIRILEANTKLWRFIECKKPLPLVGSDSAVSNKA